MPKDIQLINDIMHMIDGYRPSAYSLLPIGEILLPRPMQLSTHGFNQQLTQEKQQKLHTGMAQQSNNFVDNNEEQTPSQQ
jgi:hypothetical protein